jgi:hypothetical protein
MSKVDIAPIEPKAEKVLACMLGLSPQVLTETVWALAIQRQPNWTPDRIAIFTTKEGDAAFNDMQQSMNPSPLDQLGTRFGRADIGALAACISIEVFDALDGAAMNEAIFGFVKRLTSNPLVEVHLSIAGGRKSSSVVAGLAMSVCARSKDRMSHIIANEEVERRGISYVPSSADLENLPRLIELPFPKLGHLIDLDQSSWFTAVEGLQARLSPRSLRLDLSVPSLNVAGYVIPLQPIQAAFLLCLIDTGVNKKAEISRSGFPSHRLRTAYRRVAGHRPTPAWPEIMPPERVQEQIARINKLVLARQGVASHANLIIVGEGRPNTTYVLNTEHYELDLE